MRPPIDPARSYTIITQTVARRHLSTDYGIPRHQTARCTLDQLHDMLSEHVPDSLNGHFVVVTDKAFRMLSRRSDEIIARYHGLPIEPDAGISSMTRAREMLEEMGVDIPSDADRDGIEDALSALKETRYMILSDDDFTAYGHKMTALLKDVPTGRARE